MRAAVPELGTCVCGLLAPANLHIREPPVSLGARRVSVYPTSFDMCASWGRCTRTGSKSICAQPPPPRELIVPLAGHNAAGALTGSEADMIPSIRQTNHPGSTHGSHADQIKHSQSVEYLWAVPASRTQSSHTEDTVGQMDSSTLYAMHTLPPAMKRLSSFTENDMGGTGSTSRTSSANAEDSHAWGETSASCTSIVNIAVIPHHLGEAKHTVQVAATSQASTASTQGTMLSGSSRGSHQHGTGGSAAAHSSFNTSHSVVSCEGATSWTLEGTGMLLQHSQSAADDSKNTSMARLLPLHPGAVVAAAGPS